MLKKLASAVASLGLMFSPATVSAQAETLEMIAEGNSVLAVSGDGKVTKVPDIATFQVAVMTTGTTAKEALDENSKQMRSVFEAIKRLGISERDVQTSRVAVEPQFEQTEEIDYRRTVVPKIIGYAAVNRLLIKQRELGDFGATIDQLIAAGANAVGGPSFGLADSSKETDDARIAAVQDARRKAELYANAAGLKVVRILQISDGSFDDGAPRANFGFWQAMETGVPVAEGEVEVSASVNMVFELAPK